MTEPSRLTADVTLPRVPKQDRSRKKQEALLAAAEALFEDPGYEQVTTDDIAARAGFGTGTFYNYFTNKTQMFLMVAARHETAVVPTLGPASAAIAEGAPLLHVVREIVGTIVVERQRVPWLRRTWLRLALTERDVDVVQRRLDADWDLAIAALVTGIVDAGLATMPEVGANAIATVVRVLVDAVCDEVVLAQTITAEDAADAVAALLTALLRSA